jgi:hypothetical protein
VQTAYRLAVKLIRPDGPNSSTRGKNPIASAFVAINQRKSAPFVWLQTNSARLSVAEAIAPSPVNNEQHWPTG